LEEGNDDVGAESASQRDEDRILEQRGLEDHDPVAAGDLGGEGRRALTPIVEILLPRRILGASREALDEDELDHA
jgi:hypothetical protein